MNKIYIPIELIFAFDHSESYMNNAMILLIHMLFIDYANIFYYKIKF